VDYTRRGAGAAVSMTRYQCWLIVFIAVGLVGMHHLVHAPTAQTVPMTMASATPIQHADPDPGPRGLRQMAGRSMPSG
jgi:hypothetical protein